MASATLDHFPPDTKVQVWEKTGDSFDGGGAGEKVGRVVQVGTDGSLVLKGLDEDKEYWANGDTGQVIEFVARDPDPKGRLKGRAAQPTSGEGRRAASTGGPDEAVRPSGGAKPISATQQGGSGRSISMDDEKRVETPGAATQKPPKKAAKKSSKKKAAKSRKAPAKKKASSARVKRGAKGVTGARGSRNT